MLCLDNSIEIPLIYYTQHLEYVLLFTLPLFRRLTSK